MLNKKIKKTYSVLVLESNPAHAELITEILDENFSPIIIHIVDTIEAAYDFLQKSKYNIILTDSVIKSKSITTHIKTMRKKYKDIPIVVITGSGDEELATKLIKSGINEYITKTPESVDTLPEIIQKYLK